MSKFKVGDVVRANKSYDVGGAANIIEGREYTVLTIPMIRPGREPEIGIIGSLGKDDWWYESCFDLVAPEVNDVGGTKYDTGKARLELLSPLWLTGVARVLTFGAKKYDDHNWRKGFKQSRVLGAALRHIIAYIGGEDLDPETGLSHLYHASCCLMFASELRVTRPDLDDRYKGNANE